MLNGPWPLLVRVTVCAVELVPTFWLPKVRLVADSVTAGTPTPVPLSAIVCGLPLALSLIVIVSVRVPFVVGVNVAVSVQLLPVPSSPGAIGQLLAWAKSVPLPIAIEEILIGEPELLIVTL